MNYERPDPHLRTGWSPGATIAWVIGFLILYAVIQIPIRAFLRSGAPSLSSGDRFAIAGLATSIVLVPTIIAVVRRRPWTSLREDLALRPPKLRQAAPWLGLAAIWAVLYEALHNAGAFADPRRVLEPFTLPILGYFVVVVASPILWELIYRGFAFRGLRRAGVAIAIVLPCVIWTATHTNLDTMELAAIFVFGLILGGARWNTQSLWTGVLIYMVTRLHWLLRINDGLV